jgi:branched-chain amino acid transport system ATP-binding protein
LDADPVLVVEDLVAGYGATTILDGVSLAVRRGTITTVIGPNGAGKSTLFETIFGALRPRSGRVRFESADITSLPPRALIGRGICYVPQGRNVFPELSVRNNIELGGVAAEKNADATRRLATALDRFPVLGAKADRAASTLSAGEQKMLEIARALMLEPKLMLIDEPSIGLSPIMIAELFAILRRLRAGGITVLMIEQNTKRARELSDETVVLELGRTRGADSLSPEGRGAG